MRTKNQQYQAEDVESARNYLLKLSQGNFYHSTVNFLQRENKLE